MVGGYSQWNQRASLRHAHFAITVTARAGLGELLRKEFAEERNGLAQQPRREPGDLEQVVVAHVRPRYPEVCTQKPTKPSSGSSLAVKGASASSKTMAPTFWLAAPPSFFKFNHGFLILIELPTHNIA